MKTSIYTQVTVNIVAVFIVVILMSFVPDYFYNFFGDWKCEGSRYVSEAGNIWGNRIGCTYGDSGNHNPKWHWGYRHWIWFFMGITLFIVQFIRIVNLIDNHQKTSK